MKKTTIIFWITTGFIFLFEGVMPALTGHTELAKEGIRHLGYPEYFGTMLVVYKVIGSILLVIPNLPRKVKEWTYAGFGFDFISAFISHLVVTGFGPELILPVVLMVILVISYLQFQKLHEARLAL
jgi:hypothetical protein|uniref:DoxX family protein n=1 Tax=Fulvivirga sp. TaxID=1931237 RepID=UPI004048F33F